MNESKQKDCLLNGAERLKDIIQNDIKKSPVINSNVNIYQFGNEHLNVIGDGWVAPNPELVRSLFNEVKENFQEYNSDSKLADLIGLRSKNASVRIREFASGKTTIPYDLWRRFLVATGRVSQEPISVICIAVNKDS